MRIVLFSVFLLAPAWAQTQAPPSAAAAAEEAAKAAVQKAAPAPQQEAPAEAPSPAHPMVSVLALPPTTVIATVDGAQVTAGQLQGVIRTMPSQMQQQALGDRKSLLQYFGVVRRLAREAEKLKLDQVSPWKELLENARHQLLMQAALNQKFAETVVSQDEQKKFYDSNQQRFREARVKVIYVPFSDAAAAQADAKLLTEEQAEAKAATLVKQIRGGADFVKLVKQHSGDPASVAKDGDFGVIRRSDQLPDNLKDAIFAAKAGEVTEPVRQASGFYIFRVEEIGAEPFEQVQGNIVEELRNARFMEWMNALQNAVDIKMEEESSASPSPAPPEPPPGQ